MSLCAPAQVRALNQVLSAKSNGATDYDVVDATIQTLLDSFVDPFLTTTFRRHYDVDHDNTWKTDPYVVSLAARLGCAFALDWINGQVGGPDSQAASLQKQVVAEVEKTKGGLSTLTAARRADNPEGAGYEASFCSTSGVTPSFGPPGAGSSMDAF